MNPLDGILAGAFAPLLGTQANPPKRNAINDALNQYAAMQSRPFSQGFDMGTHPSDYANAQASMSAYGQQLALLGMAHQRFQSLPYTPRILSEEELRERKFKADAEKELCECLGIASIHDVA